MNERPYLLASERADLVFGNLRDGATGELGSCWRIAPKADAMLGGVFVFVPRPGHNRTDEFHTVKVVSEARYLRDEEEPYYRILSRRKGGDFERYGAHARADELWPVGDEVTIWIHCDCCGKGKR